VEAADATTVIEVAVALYEPRVSELSGTTDDPDDPLADSECVPVKLLGGALPEIVDKAVVIPVEFGADDDWGANPVEVPGKVPLVIPPEAAPLALVKEAETEAGADDSPAENSEVVPIREPVIPLDTTLVTVTVAEVKLAELEREPTIVPVVITELNWAEVVGWAAPEELTPPEEEAGARLMAVETTDDVLVVAPLGLMLAEATPEVTVLVFDTTAELVLGPDVALATELLPTAADWG
jgi:hypothetical protein